MDNYKRGYLKLGVASGLGKKSKCGFTVGTHICGDRNIPFAGSAFEANTESCGSAIDVQKSAVLSQNIQLVQSPEGVIPSTVRFERFDYLTLGWGESFYELYPLVVLAEKGDFALGDWKVDVLTFSHPVALSERGGENIQGTANCVDIGSGFDVEREWERLFLESYDKIVRGIFFELTDTYLKASFDPSIYACVEGLEIGFGPVQCCGSELKVVTQGEGKS
ncbi:MAG: hypothetical protein WA831_03380 [Methylovirgula sp.]